MNIFNKKFWIEGLGSYVLLFMLAMTIRWGFLEAYVIPSGSMLPSLLIHDHIFVWKPAYGLRIPFTEKWLVKWADPQRGDVIVFKYPENMSDFYVKRVVAVAGDKVEVKDGRLLVNDQPTPRYIPQGKSGFDYLKDEDFQEGQQFFNNKLQYKHLIEELGEQRFSILLREGVQFDSFQPVTVPEGHLFMLGDNRNNSKDSRYWGFLPEENILGKALVVWLSCEKTLPVLSFLCNPLTMRWSRLGHGVHSEPSDSFIPQKDSQ